MSELHIHSRDEIINKIRHYTTSIGKMDYYAIMIHGTEFAHTDLSDLVDNVIRYQANAEIKRLDT
jgi:hypothetical protein